MAPGRKRGANKAIALEELRLGDLVLAKVKGFPAWPAKIGRPEDWDKVPDPKKFFVQFFGTEEIAFVTPHDIQAFTSETKNKVVERCRGKTVKYFVQAVEEISAAFEKLQNHESDVLGDESLLNAAEPSLTKPKILDGNYQIEASNDVNSAKVDSRADPCLQKLVENNGEETKPDVGEENSSPSNNRTTLPSSRPLEHGSADPILKVADVDDKLDGLTCTEHGYGAGKNSVDGQGIVKTIVGDSDKRCKDEVHRGKLVSDSRAARDNHPLCPDQKLKGSKKGEDRSSKKESLDSKMVSDHSIPSSKKSKELLKEKPSSRVCGDKHLYARGSKSEILGKKKRFESERGKSASGVDESKRAAKRPRSEDGKDQKQCKSRRLLPVGGGKHEIVLGVSAQGGKLQFDEEEVAYTKRRKQTGEHTSVYSFSGSCDKEGKKTLERKISSSSTGDVKAALLPKRRRMVCIYDEDDDEDSKTPVNGGHINVTEATPVSAVGPKSANASHDTPCKEKPLKQSDVKIPATQLLKRRRAVCINDDDDDEDPKTPVHGGQTNVAKATLAASNGPKSDNASHGTSCKAKPLKQSDVKVQAAQMPKRRRAVCINEGDDDEVPKTPVHGGPTNVAKATSASTDGPKSANASRDTSIKAKLLAGSAESAEVRKVHLPKHNKDVLLALPDSMEGPSYSSPKGKPVTVSLPKNVKPILRSPKKFSQLVSFKEQVTGQSKTAKVSGARMPSLEAPRNSSSMGKPVTKLPPKNVKQILRSPMKSPQLVSTKDQVAGQNKVAKVSGVGMPNKCQGVSSKNAVADSVKVDSQSQTANQRRKPASGEKPTSTLKVATRLADGTPKVANRLTDGTPKAATRLTDAGVLKNTSGNLSASMINVNQEHGRAPLLDTSSSIKDLLAAAKEKRKQAHSHTPPSVNLNHNLPSNGEMQMRSHTPSVVQNVSSSAGDAVLIVAQEHQEDFSPSNHGHHSPSCNQAETKENEERRVSSGHRSVGGSPGGCTEAAISRDAFEGMIETLSRTKESIGRATRLAIKCAKYGIASEVVELLIRKLEIEPHFNRKVDLFFLVDSITQCSHSQRGIAGALYIPTVQAVLPRLLGAAAPPGTGARENRRQCRKVLKLWLERKIFPDSLLRRYIGDISASGDDTVGFSLRRPSRSERAIDDPLREMEGMLVDEYGSNASFQLPGFLTSYTFEDDEEDEDLPIPSEEVEKTHIEEAVHPSEKLEAHDCPSHEPNCVLEKLDGVVEMEDASCQPIDEVPSYVCGTEAKENSPVSPEGSTAATELHLFPEGSPPLPHESPPSPPPLPPSPPPSSPPPPPSSPAQLPPPPPSRSEQCSPPQPPSEQCSPPPPARLAPLPPPKSIALPPSSKAQASMPGHPSVPLQPGFPPPAYPLLQHGHQIPMQREQHSSIATSNQVVQVLVNAADGRHADVGEKSEYLVQQSSCFAVRMCKPSQIISPKQLEYGNGDLLSKHEASSQLGPSNTSFLQRPMIRDLPSAPPSSHFLPPSFPHPYPFPSQPVEGRRPMNEEPWRLPSNGPRADIQNGAWINPLPGSRTVTDDFFQPPPERPPVSYPLAANSLQAGPTISGHNMLSSRPDITSAARWRPS